MWRLLFKSWLDGVKHDAPDVPVSQEELALDASIVYAHEIKRWEPGSIAAYFRLSLDRVLKVIKKFKRRIYRDKEKKYLKFFNTRRKVNSVHISAIEDFILMHKGQSFTIRDIQYCLDTYYPQLTKVSDWSIRKILKENLRFSYKRLCLIQRKLFRLEFSRRFFESALFQTVLEDEGYELLQY